MRVKNISFQDTGSFSKLLCDYLAENEDIKFLYDQFPNEKGFKKQLFYKQSQFSEHSRTVLGSSFKAQYKNVVMSKETQDALNSLLNTNTFTVVTGHQLNLFTGPLYFLYKIVSTINLAKELKKKFPTKNFVPVYWMATEDHDFEEVNHLFVNQNKISWDTDFNGPLGNQSTAGLALVFEKFSNEIGTSSNARYLKELFQKAYLEHTNLKDATRYLVNELFGNQGLLILDGNDKRLKEQFIPYFKNELLNQVAFKTVSDTNLFLAKNYKVQAHTREINLFYIKGKLRERILYKNKKYLINNTSISFSQTAILKELENHPEYFSPNVITRPLYQEVLLPNLCYVGGGGELAYWLQLKAFFKKSAIPFPILLVRNSVLLISKKQGLKLDQLGISSKELFMKQEALITKKVKELSTLSIDLTEQKEVLQQLFKDLLPLVKQTDRSFEGALKAQEKKQLKGLEYLEKRLLKAEKKKQKDLIIQAQTIQDHLFPRKGLQERNANFTDFYLEYGEAFIPALLRELKPLQLKFLILDI